MVTATNDLSIPKSLEKSGGKADIEFSYDSCDAHVPRLFSNNLNHGESKVVDGQH